MLRILAVFSLLLTSTQAWGAPQRLEFEHVIDSEPLQEKRLITVSVPTDISDRGNGAYPVLFVLDGEWTFDYAAGVIDILSDESFGYVPEMIVVGIPNTDRNRDMSPVGFMAFLEFLESEVIPLVDREYRTTGFRLIYGWSSGAGITIQLFAREPGLFDAYMASGSGIGPVTREYLGAQIPKTTYEKQFLYVNAEGGGIRADTTSSFAELIDTLAPDGLTWKFEILDNSSHIDVLREGLPAGLAFVFSGFRVPESVATAGADAVVAFLEESRRRFRSDIAIPQGAFIESAVMMLQSGMTEEAVDLLQRAMGLYPDSGTMADALGEVHAYLKEYGEAAEAYEKAMQLAGDDMQSALRFETMHRKFHALAEETDAGHALLGNWLGQLQIPDGPTLAIGVEFFVRADGSIFANVSSPDQGVRYMRVANLELSAEEFTAHLADMPVIIKGRLNDDGKLDGQFSQGDSTWPLTFSHADAVPEPPRNQNTPLPAELIEKDVRFHNGKDDVWLSGTVTMPRSATAENPVPAVLLLAGSGPADRDAFHSGHRPLQVLARFLASQGIATLRADKRGVLKSTGDFSTAGLEDFARDASAGIDFLVEQPGIDGDRVGILGHSEGSLVAAMVAAQKPSLPFIVSLSGPGRPAIEVLIDQDGTEPAAAGASENDVAILRAFSRRFYDTVLAIEDPEDRRAALQSLYDNLQGEEASIVNQWNQRQGTLDVNVASQASFARLLQSNPGDYWRHVTRSPVLLVAGGKDVQVDAEKNLEAIASVLRKHGNDNADVLLIPDVNHMMQTAGSGALEEYGELEESFSPEVAGRIAKWLLEHVAH